MGGSLISHPYLHPLDIRLLMDDPGFDRNVLNQGGNVNIFHHFWASMPKGLIVDKG